MKPVIIIAILFVLLIPLPIFALSHPDWVENILTWYEEGKISKQDMTVAIEYLVNLGILRDEYLEKELTPHDCSGTARCITGTVTSVIDGDTIKIDGQSIRFALASAPELNELNGPEARNFIDEICPVGSTATVDEDDGQTEGSYGRIVGVIYCNGMNLNEELVDSGLGYLSTGFCDNSEFSTQLWALKHGCTNLEYETTNQQTQNCDPSYPDFCIPSPPPDLDCIDISQKKFTVLQPDPHRFDGDKDGIGCES